MALMCMCMNMDDYPHISFWIELNPKGMSCNSCRTDQVVASASVPIEFMTKFILGPKSIDNS